MITLYFVVVLVFWGDMLENEYSKRVGLSAMVQISKSGNLMFQYISMHLYRYIFLERVHLTIRSEEQIHHVTLWTLFLIKLYQT